MLLAIHTIMYTTYTQFFLIIQLIKNLSKFTAYTKLLKDLTAIHLHHKFTKFANKTPAYPLKLYTILVSELF